MNTMMMALLQGRLWDAASNLQQQLRLLDAEADAAGQADGKALAEELSQVIHALDALRAGRYGDCTECAQPLELDRLLMRPHRLLCAACERHGGMPVFAHHTGFKAPSPAAGAAAG